MIAYRPFRNNDPPQIIRLWNGQPPQRWLSQPLTLNRFEQLVLGHAYFTSSHFYVAQRDGQIVGFVHLGFGPTADGSSLDLSTATLSGLFVAADESFEEIAQGLMFCADEIAKNLGVKRRIAGGLFPIDPFYWGLYGGPLSAGIVVSDTQRCEFFRQAGYRETRRFVIWERDLATFRPLVDRFQMQLKRKYQVEATSDLLPNNWWEANVYSHIERARYTLREPNGKSAQAAVTYWDMQHLDERLGKRTVGLLSADFEAVHATDGTVVYLFGESMRHLQSLGLTHVQATTPADDPDWTRSLTALGFAPIEQSIVLEKT